MLLCMTTQHVAAMKSLSWASPQVVSGDVLAIKDSSSGAERRVTLSSIRAPRPARRDEKPEPYGTEAKEFLRQRLIGALFCQCVLR